jgi:hypothetical protein
LLISTLNEVEMLMDWSRQLGQVAGAVIEAELPATSEAHLSTTKNDGMWDFFLAKTVLLPGHVGTPEYGVLLKTSLDQSVKAQMLERCNTLSYKTMCTTQDFAVRRWFHTHGVPQVMPCTTPLFDYGD